MSTTFLISQTLGTPRNNFAGCVGYEFNVGSESILIEAMARWKLRGNTQVHTLRIMSGPGVDIGAAQVNMSGGGLPDAYVWVNFNAFLLPKNNTYWIFCSETNGGDAFYDTDTIPLATAPAATIVRSAFEHACGIDINAATDGRIYGPLNFRYRLAPKLTMLSGGPYQPLSNAGLVVPFGLLYFYQANTGFVTPLPTYTDVDGLNQDTNPVRLDPRGARGSFSACPHRTTSHSRRQPASRSGSRPTSWPQRPRCERTRIWLQPNVVANAAAF